MTILDDISLDVGLSPDLLRNTVDAVRSQMQAKRIILFGSRGKGEFSATSDIDLAVELKPLSHTLLRCEVEEKVRTLLRVDIVDLSEVPHHLKSEILTTGVILYEEDSSDEG